MGRQQHSLQHSLNTYAYFIFRELQASDLVDEKLDNSPLVDVAERLSGLREITRKLEAAIDLVKTKQGDAIVILVGGGSVIIKGQLAGVAMIIRPTYLEVANAIGAAVCLSLNTMLIYSTKFFLRLPKSVD